MKARRSLVLLGLLAIALALVALPAPVAAQEVTFGQPTAQAELGRPITFSTSLQAASAPDNVELLLSRPGERSATVMPADVRSSGTGWLVEATLEGEVPPNSIFEYRFRLRHADGSVDLGPAAEVIVVDRRFSWRTIAGDIIRLHWYEGSDDFARRALEIGEGAIRDAAELLGVTETEPIDFFIYASEPDLRGALGPGTRENVGGQAHADIRTMFGLIEPHQINSDWVDVLVIHELTHLVFDTATDNLYHSPPRWLNEGVAVYLSEGYNPRWRSVIDRAVAREEIIPLDGLGGLFPTTRDQFELAYAESVSAVDFFIETHGEPTLWSLVRSYADGVSDDEAFRAATGADLAAFNAAWMASLGLDVPQPLGPRPGPAGPLPPGWDGTDVPASPPPGAPTETPPTATPGAGPTPAGPTTPAPGATAPPAEPGTDADGTLVVAGTALVVVLGVLVAAMLLRRRLLP
jgi:hypothetical protein